MRMLVEAEGDWATTSIVVDRTPNVKPGVQPNTSARRIPGRERSICSGFSA
ncbi:MAG: hypothetical protein VB875_09305 [Pirellulales bacterium]